MTCFEKVFCAVGKCLDILISAQQEKLSDAERGAALNMAGHHLTALFIGADMGSAQERTEIIQELLVDIPTPTLNGLKMQTLEPLTEEDYDKIKQILKEAIPCAQA